MSENAMSTAALGGGPVEIQTPENTTAPHEPSPSTAPVKKSSGFTKEMRDAKIAGGWIPPEKRPKKPVAVAKEDLAIISVSEGVKANREPMPGWVNPADKLLKALVDKLVALENNEQYVSVWTHFFVHGGVFNGPKYLDELNEAIQYLVGIENAKTSVGKQS